MRPNVGKDWLWMGTHKAYINKKGKWTVPRKVVGDTLIVTDKIITLTEIDLIITLTVTD